MPDSIKVKIEGFGDKEWEVTEEGMQSLAEHAQKSMKDSHDQALAHANETTKERERREKAEALVEEVQSQKSTPSQAQSTRLKDIVEEVNTRGYMEGKDIESLATIIKQDIESSVASRLQGYQHSSQLATSEAQSVALKLKYPDLTQEQIGHIVGVNTAIQPEGMKRFLMEKGLPVTVSADDLALFVLGIKKDFRDDTGGAQKQEVRGRGGGEGSKKDTEEEKLVQLGFSEADIVGVKQLCKENKMTIQDWIDHHHPHPGAGMPEKT